MEPVVFISDDGTLHVGRAEIPVARRQFDPTAPSLWLIRAEEDSLWEPLEWIANMAAHRTQVDLIPGILRGASAGNSEVYLDPIDSADARPELAARWTEETGLDPGPSPMVLGVSWGKEELLVPLPYLQAIYETLRTQMAPYRADG